MQWVCIFLAFRTVSKAGMFDFGEKDPRNRRAQHTFEGHIPGWARYFETYTYNPIICISHLQHYNSYTYIYIQVNWYNSTDTIDRYLYKPHVCMHDVLSGTLWGHDWPVTTEVQSLKAAEPFCPVLLSRRSSGFDCRVYNLKNLAKVEWTGFFRMFKVEKLFWMNTFFSLLVVVDFFWRLPFFFPFLIHVAPGLAICRWLSGLTEVADCWWYLPRSQVVWEKWNDMANSDNE